MITSTLLALLLAAPAQTGTIQGTVVREGTTEPVAGVKITVGGGAPMNPRQAQMILSAQAIGMNILPEDVEAARTVIAKQASGEAAAAATSLTAVTTLSVALQPPQMPTEISVPEYPARLV